MIEYPKYPNCTCSLCRQPMPNPPFERIGNKQAAYEEKRNTWKRLMGVLNPKPRTFAQKEKDRISDDS